MIDDKCMLHPGETALHTTTHAGPELGIFLEPLVLQEKGVVVLAVNNNASTDTAGGSHWYVGTQRFPQKQGEDL